MQKSGPAPPQACRRTGAARPLPSRAARLRVPFWAIAGFVGLLLFGVFVGLRLSLGHRAEAAAEALARAEPGDAGDHRPQGRGAPPPPPPPTPEQISQLDHIRTVLAPNIAAGTLSVEPSADQIVIRIVDRDLFKPGKSALLDDVKPLMTYIALALDDEAAIKVIGHSDNTPISNARFASNFELSLERAKVVGAILSNPCRIPSASSRKARAPTNRSPLTIRRRAGQKSPRRNRRSPQRLNQKRNSLPRGRSPEKREWMNRKLWLRILISLIGAAAIAALIWFAAPLIVVQGRPSAGGAGAPHRRDRAGAGADRRRRRSTPLPAAQGGGAHRARHRRRRQRRAGAGRAHEGRARRPARGGAAPTISTICPGMC